MTFNSQNDLCNRHTQTNKRDGNNKEKPKFKNVPSYGETEM